MQCERRLAGNPRQERALFAATVLAIGLLLGPGFGIVNKLAGPAADATGAMSWPEQLYVAPEAAFVRAMTALGLVLAVRLLAGVLLAFVARVPGRAGVCAARLSIYLTPPLARRYVSVIISVSLSSWTGVALSSPAIAATHLAAPTVVPAPVLAPPEATLQTWPDLGRPGTDVRSSTTPGTTNSAEQRSWPDLGRSGTDVPPSPAPPRTTAPRIQPPSSRQPDPAARVTQSGDGPAAKPAARPTPAAKVVVAPGDCLWAIAQHELERGGQPAPAAADVAVATDRWWQANRAVLGPDPNRLLPGEQLRPPA